MSLQSSVTFSYIDIYAWQQTNCIFFFAKARKSVGIYGTLIGYCGMVSSSRQSFLVVPNIFAQKVTELRLSIRKERLEVNLYDIFIR